MLFSNLLCFSVIFSALLCSFVLFCASSVLHSALLCSSVFFLCSVVLLCVLLYCSVFFCCLLCSSVLFRALLFPFGTAALLRRNICQYIQQGLNCWVCAIPPWLKWWLCFTCWFEWVIVPRWLRCGGFWKGWEPRCRVGHSCLCSGRPRHGILRDIKVLSFGSGMNLLHHFQLTS